MCHASHNTESYLKRDLEILTSKKKKNPWLKETYATIELSRLKTPEEKRPSVND